MPDEKEDAAVEELNAEEATKHLTAQEWFWRGHAATDFDEQIRLYSEAIRLKPDYPFAFQNRGDARRAKGDRDGALQDYSEAIRLKSDFARAFYNRGNERYNQGDLQGALQDYSEAIRLKPDFAEAFYNRGLVRQAKGDRKGANEDFKKVPLYARSLGLSFLRDLFSWNTPLTRVGPILITY